MHSYFEVKLSKNTPYLVLKQVGVIYFGSFVFGITFFEIFKHDFFHPDF